MLLQLTGYGGKEVRARKRLSFDSKTGREDFLYSASATIPLETIRFASGVNYCEENEPRLIIM